MGGNGCQSARGNSRFQGPDFNAGGEPCDQAQRGQAPALEDQVDRENGAKQPEADPRPGGEHDSTSAKRECPRGNDPAAAFFIAVMQPETYAQGTHKAQKSPENRPETDRGKQRIKDDDRACETIDGAGEEPQTLALPSGHSEGIDEFDNAAGKYHGADVED